MPDVEPETCADPVVAAVAHFRLDVAQMVTPAESYSSTVRLITLTGGERLVLKIPYTKVKLFREMTALRVLAADLPVPEVIDAWVPGDEAPGALLLSWLPGIALDPSIGAHGGLDLIRQMGALLAALHAHRVAAFGEVHDPAASEPAGWWGMMNRRFQLWIHTCTGVVPQRKLAEIEGVFAALSADLPTPDGPCWVHADFRPANILVEDGRITGLIDFESARGGSADFDFVKVSHALFDTRPGSREAFLAGYDTVRPHPDLTRTLPYYRLHNAVGGLAWCIRRTNVDDPFYRENEVVIAEIIEAYRQRNQ